MIEAYKIGITIAVTNHVSGVLGLMGRDFVKTDAQAARLKKTLGEIKLLGVAGTALAGAGFAIAAGLKPAYEAAKRYEMAFGRFKALQLGDVVNRDADTFARSTRLMGVSATGLMETLQDLHVVMGSYEHAKALAPTISRMLYANEALYEGRFNQRQAADMARVIEMRGGFKSQEEMLAQAEMMQKVMTGTSGRVMPSDYLSIIKTGGIAAKNIDPNAFYYTMEPLIQELGGLRVGTGLMTAYNTLTGVTKNNRQQEELAGLGLIRPGAIKYSPSGKILKMEPNSLKGQGDLERDPFGFMMNDLIPAFAKAGITSEKAIISEFGRVMPRTASQLFSTMYQQRDKIEKARRITMGAAGIEELQQLADKSPRGAEIAFHMALDNLDTAVGRALLPIVIPAINSLASGFQYLADVSRRHPTLTKYLIEGAVALGVLATAAGGFLLLTSAMKGVQLLLGATGLPMAFRALTGALGVGGAGMLGGILPLVAGIGAAMAAIGGLLYAFDPDFKKFVDERAQHYWSGLDIATRVNLKTVRELASGVWKHAIDDFAELGRSFDATMKSVGNVGINPLTLKTLMGDANAMLADLSDLFAGKLPRSFAASWTKLQADWQGVETAITGGFGTLKSKIADFFNSMFPDLGRDPHSNNPAPGAGPQIDPNTVAPPGWHNPRSNIRNQAYHPDGGGERPIVLMIDDRNLGRVVVGMIDRAAGGASTGYDRGNPRMRAMPAGAVTQA